MGNKHDGEAGEIKGKSAKNRSHWKDAGLKPAETLDEKIEEARDDYRMVASGRESSASAVESARTQYIKLMEQKTTRLTADAEIAQTEMQKISVENTNKTNAQIAVGHDRANIKVAQLNNEAVRIQQDPHDLSQLEVEVLKIAQKYNILGDSKAYQELANTSTDKDIKADALTFERDLKKLGMSLKVDGKIDDKTISGLEALLSKNAPAIMAYKEITGIDLLKPAASPANKRAEAIQKD